MSNRFYAWTALYLFSVTLAIGLVVAFGTWLLIGIAVIMFIGGGAFLVRFALMPILAQAANIERVRAETAIMLDMHAAQLERMPRAYLAAPDANGNYAQPLDAYGNLIDYLPPGNSQAPRTVNALRDYYDIEETEDDQDQRLLPEQAGAIDPATATAPTFDQERAAGLFIPGGPVVLGYEIVIDEMTGAGRLEPISNADGTTEFWSGASTAGKSSLMARVTTLQALRGDTVFAVIDPHMYSRKKERALYTKIGSLAPWFITSPITGHEPRELRQLLDLLKREVDTRFSDNEDRKRLSPFYGLKIRLVVDEAYSFCIKLRMDHDPVYDEFFEFMQQLGTQTAKEDITAAFMSQMATKDELGPYDIRAVCPSKILLRLPREHGQTFAITGAQAKDLQFFPRGRGYFIDGEEGGLPRLFVWSYVSPEQIAQVVRGAVSPLATSGRQTGKKILDLPTYEALETGWKEDGNKYGNEFPPALQARLASVPNWRGKLDALAPIFGGDMREVWQTLFDRAPGGRDHAELKAQYDALADALRWRINEALRKISR